MRQLNSKELNDLYNQKLAFILLEGRTTWDSRLVGCIFIMSDAFSEAEYFCGQIGIGAERVESIIEPVSGYHFVRAKCIFGPPDLYGNIYSFVATNLQWIYLSEHSMNEHSMNEH